MLSLLSILPVTARKHRPGRRWRVPGLEYLEPRRLLAADLIFQPPIEVEAHDQLVVELINRARANPLAEAARFDLGLNSGVSDSISPSPKPPLALHQSLLDASLLHSLDMLAHNYFSHEGRDGSRPTDRAQDAGYPGVAGENIALSYDGGQSPQEQAEQVHEQLFRSPGHRANMLLERYREVGIGMAWGTYSFDDYPNQPSAITTQMFGIRSQQFMTGVAYSDSVIGDDFYSVGEGWANLRIEARDASGQVYATTTGSSGGYRLMLPDGEYIVTARLPHEEGLIRLGTATIEEDVNLKIDIRMDQAVIEEDPQLPKDLTPPTSTIDADMSRSYSTTFLLRWDGSDEVGSPDEPASGVESFDLYVSVDDGDFELWKNFTESGEAEFTGAYGHTYAFYVLATDVAGNRERVPPMPDVVVEVVSPWKNEVNPLDVDGNGRVNPFDALLIVSWLNSAGPNGQHSLNVIYEPGQEIEPPFVDVNGDGIVNPFDVLLIVSHLAGK